ncbi:uncharacterized protein LOC135224845 [Macrobrachium nipponense]|uniref:uncharacterized protein LOC135224845 n=1 Tax=Macrobrachium nipponense TaxID=159736 RepID=UPI0030C815B4
METLHEATPIDDGQNVTLIETEDSQDVEDDVPTGHKKSLCVILSDENERLVGEWLEHEAQFIYNKRMAAYKDKAKVWKAFDDKGMSLRPPVTGNELRTWFTSLKSRFGRLTAEKSGQGASRRLTDQEKWMLNIFHFLKPHIIRQKKPKMSGLPMVSSS